MYGALGLAPPLLMWLNISWMLFVLGAKIVYLVEAERSGRANQPGVLPK